VAIVQLQSSIHCDKGEPHAGERRYTEVSAGTRAKQDCAATRSQRTESVRRVGLARLTRRRRATVWPSENSECVLPVFGDGGEGVKEA
jgi:hypothetical protein